MKPSSKAIREAKRKRMLEWIEGLSEENEKNEFTKHHINKLKNDKEYREEFIAMNINFSDFHNREENIEEMCEHIANPYKGLPKLFKTLTITRDDIIKLLREKNILLEKQLSHYKIFAAFTGSFCVAFLFALFV